MKKRILSCLLALTLALGLWTPAWAAPSAVSESEAMQAVNALGIMVGDKNGNFNLTRTVTRAEFVTMAVKATPGGANVGQAAYSPYPDVPRSHWAAGYIAAGIRANLVTGYLDGTFRPGSQITLAEGATIALKLLGYTSADFAGAYPTGQMAKYHDLKLDRGVTVTSPSAVLTRRDAMYLFYNLLSAPAKDSAQPYITSLGHTLNAAGQVDLVSLVNGSMEGPIVADGSWQSSLPFSARQATVYRNGAQVKLDGVQKQDLVYWNESMKTIWAYSDKITGRLQSVSPSVSQPTSLTLAGHTYSIETSGAAYALSDMGTFKEGDTVTLLLGRTGGVAAVVAPNAREVTRCGIITAVSKDGYSDGSGGTYTDDTITFWATDGQSYTYQWRSNYFKVGDLVRAEAGEDGELKLTRLSPTRLNGKVSADGTKLGNYEFAPDVEILDTYEGKAVKIYADRLAGMTLQDGMVQYYTLDGQGHIDRMVLKEATGDAYTYGILTDINNQSAGMFIQVTYTMFLEGQYVSYVSQNKDFNVTKTGPFYLKGTPSDPKEFCLLNRVPAGAKIVDNTTLAYGNEIYLFADNVIVYEHVDGRYIQSTLARVQDEGLQLTFWYDRAPSAGGRIRMVLAE